MKKMVKVEVESDCGGHRARLMEKRASVLSGLGTRFDTLACMGRVAEDDQAQISHDEFVSLRMNGLDSFGRMAGLLAASKGSPGAAVTAEEQKQPDISQAVILHAEEWQEEDNRVAKQPALL